MIEVCLQDVNMIVLKLKVLCDFVQDQYNVMVMFNGMIVLVILYVICGVLWYQGELIVGGEVGVVFYLWVQVMFVNDWCLLWKQGDFFFYIVQFVGQNKLSNCLEVCEVQVIVFVLKNIGMVVMMDIGEEKNVYLYNKQVVGDWLVCIVLVNMYGKVFEFFGLCYELMVVEVGGVI